MSRISPKPEKKYPWYARFFFWLQRKKYGQVLEPAKLWARSPRVFLGVAALYGALDRKGSPIDPMLRALITVKVSQINWCTFCVDINSATVLKRGGSEPKLKHLENYKGSDSFTDKEKIVLEYAEAMTLTEAVVTDEMFDRLRQYFDEDALCELTGLIAFQNLSSKFNATLDVQPQGFCDMAPQRKKEEDKKEVHVDSSLGNK